MCLGDIGTSPIVLVLDFFGHGKRADCRQRSKIENEDDDEDDWRGAYTALTVACNAQGAASDSPPKISTRTTTNAGARPYQLSNITRHKIVA